MRIKFFLIIALIIAVFSFIASYYFSNIYNDKQILCPEYVRYAPILDRISENEILLFSGPNKNRTLEIGESFEIQYPHEIQECALREINDAYAIFDCDMGCVMYCSGRYKSKFEINIPILKDMIFDELRESGNASLIRQYFEHKVYNCNLYKT